MKFMKNLNFIDINFNVYSEDENEATEATICIMINFVTFRAHAYQKKR